MTWSRKTTRIATAGYLLIAALILGGLAWTTVLSLRLERRDRREQWRRENHDRQRLALGRMDYLVQSTLTREVARRPSEYTALHYPTRLWDRRGLPRKVGDTVEVSSLVSAELEPWLLLHFQVSSSQGWSSPQVPTPNDELNYLVGFAPGPSTNSKQAAQMLAALQRALTPADLAGLLAQAWARDLSHTPWALEDRLMAESIRPHHDQSVAQDDDRPVPDPLTAEYLRRGRRSHEALSKSQATEECFPDDVAQAQLLNEPPLPELGGAAGGSVGDSAGGSAGGSADSDESPADITVTPSPMTAVWLDLPGRADLDLAFLRTVPVGHETIYQGFLIDWPRLAAILKAEISEDDLLPQAQLLPVRSGPVEDFETMMTMLPVQLDCSECQRPLLAAAGWTSVHTGLLLAWIAAVTVLLAVGLGVRNLLGLAERRRQFAYAVSHELRTPLTTFRLYTEMLSENLVPPEHRAEYINTLNEESQRLSDLVNGVLEYSRIEHQTVKPVRTPTRVAQVLEQVRQRCEGPCSQGDHQLTIETNGLAELSWPTDSDLVVQILGTLTDNACKYANPAEDPRIIVSAQQTRSDQLCFEVRDFGPGVPRQERRQIFQPFRRGRSCATSSSGIGLGLALAQRWAKLLGGRLELVQDHTISSGACFRLYLPTHA